MRIISWILLFLCGVWGGGAVAVEVTDGPRIEVTKTSATLRWKTDVACGSSVNFGVAAGRLPHRRETSAIATSHTVELDGLQPGTRYFFSIGTARKALKEGHFNTIGDEGRGPQPVPSGIAVPAKVAPEPPEPTATRPANSDKQAPPAATTWGKPATLRDHFERHGKDFASKNPDDYAAKAWHFLQRAKKEGLPAKRDPDGVLRVWDPRSGAFAAYNPDGTTKTYFKPNSPDYFDRQPGRPVKLNATQAPR